MKMDLALNKLEWLICHKTKPNQIDTALNSNSSSRRIEGLIIFKIILKRYDAKCNGHDHDLNSNR